MNIAIFTHIFGVGGTTTYIHDLAVNLQHKGHRVVVFGAEGDGLKTFLNDGITTKLIPELCDQSSFLQKMYFYFLPKRYRKSFRYNKFVKIKLRTEINELIRLIIYLLKKPTRRGGIRIQQGSLRILKGVIKVVKELEEFNPQLMITTQLQPAIIAMEVRRRLGLKVPIYEFVMGIRDTYDVVAPWNVSRQKKGDKLLITTGEVGSTVGLLSRKHDLFFAGNCIDTNRYSPRNKEKSFYIRKKMGFTENDIIITTILSSVLYLEIAKDLIKAFSLIYRDHPSIRLLVICPRQFHGVLETERSRFEQLINKINLHDTITDKIEDIYAISNLCIGVGRVARESMACGVPCIVSGPEGYSGLIQPENVEKARFYNFTGRENITPMRIDRIKNDLLNFLHLSVEERILLEQWSREYIVENESIEGLINSLELG